VESAFLTEIHTYRLGGKTHFANATDLSVPQALAGMTQSIGNIHSFQPRSHLRIAAPSPSFTSSQSGSHYLTPKDVATIYDVSAAYGAGYTGTGQAIAVVGQSAISVSDIEAFQSAAGLTKKAPTLVLVPRSGTSTVVSGDEAESDLDLEYAGGIAKDATIYFVYVGNNSNYSAFDSIQYAVDANIAPIISVSYGACETELSSSDSSTLESIMEQGASQGQSIIVASGDDGSTGCYGTSGMTTAQQEALVVDYPASSAYVTGVGGTEFPSSDVSSSNSTYWEPASGTDLISSAKSYIPEQVWNDDSSSSGLSSGGGGTSLFTSRPSWQAGVTGIPSGSYRLVPDISLSSSPNNAGYLYCSSDSSGTGITGSCSNGFRDNNDRYLTVAGGTSFAAPIFAGMLAIINQRENSTGLGLINKSLYTLAANSETYASAFHDITSGSNACTAGSSYCSSTGQSAYSATVGYDEATGLGSVDFYNLMTAWPSPSASSTLLATVTSLSAASANPSSGASDVITITVTPGSSSTSTPTGTLTVTVDGTTATSSLSLSSGTASYTFSSTTAGSHVIAATYSGDSTFASSTGSVAVTVGSSSTTSSGGSGSTTVTVTPSGGYTGTVSFSLSTSNSYLQADACYDISSATISGTSSASQQLTVHTGSSYCSNSAVESGRVHSFGRVVRRSASSKSSSVVNGAALGSLGIVLAGLVGFRRRRFGILLGSLFLILVSTCFCGCGGASTTSTTKSFSIAASPTTITVAAGSSGIPKGNYSVSLQGQDSSNSNLTATTALTITIDWRVPVNESVEKRAFKERADLKLWATDSCDFSRVIRFCRANLSRPCIREKARGRAGPEGGAWGRHRKHLGPASRRFSIIVRVVTDRWKSRQRRF
jgi:subtilase family serine protease